jgi:hypothetical protein
MVWIIDSEFNEDKIGGSVHDGLCTCSIERRHGGPNRASNIGYVLILVFAMQLQELDKSTNKSAVQLSVGSPPSALKVQQVYSFWMQEDRKRA